MQVSNFKFLTQFRLFNTNILGCEMKFGLCSPKLIGTYLREYYRKVKVTLIT